MRESSIVIININIITIKLLEKNQIKILVLIHEIFSTKSYKKYTSTEIWAVRK